MRFGSCAEEVHLPSLVRRRMRLGDDFDWLEAVQETILQIRRLRRSVCGAHGCSAPPRSVKWCKPLIFETKTIDMKAKSQFEISRYTTNWVAKLWDGMIKNYKNCMPLIFSSQLNILKIIIIVFSSCDFKVQLSYILSKISLIISSFITIKSSILLF